MRKVHPSTLPVELVLEADVLHDLQSTRFPAPRDGMPTGPAREFVLACGRCELAPDERTALVDLGRMLPPQEWIAVATLAQHHHMGPLVFKHVAEAGLLPIVPTDTAASLKHAYCTALVNNRRAQLDLEALLAELRERQVEAIAVKGVALAARHYHTIALRPANDIDLLVRRRDLSRAISALHALGYCPAPGMSRRLDFRVLRFLEMHYTKANGPTVELHLELVRNQGYQTVLAVPQLFARSQPLSVGREVVRYLDPADELRYLSLHCTVQHRFNPLYEYWLWNVDLAVLMRSLPSEWDWERFIGETRELSVALPVALALARTRDLLGIELPAAVWQALAVAARAPDEMANWRKANTRFSNPAHLWRHLMSLRGAAEKSMFVVGVGLGGLEIARRLVRGLIASESAHLGARRDRIH